MIKLNAIRSCVPLILLVMVATLCRLSYANDSPQIGNRYEIIRPIYLTAVYNSMKTPQISREMARAYLISELIYFKHSYAFQSKVPVGTVMTIIGPAPKVWNIPFLAKRYFVRLEPDPSRGLDVELVLYEELKGSLDGLNPEIFRLLQN